MDEWERSVPVRAAVADVVLQPFHGVFVHAIREDFWRLVSTVRPYFAQRSTDDIVRNLGSNHLVKPFAPLIAELVKDFGGDRVGLLW